MSDDDDDDGNTARTSTSSSRAKNKHRARTASFARRVSYLPQRGREHTGKQQWYHPRTPAISQSRLDYNITTPGGGVRDQRYFISASRCKVQKRRQRPACYAGNYNTAVETERQTQKLGSTRRQHLRAGGGGYRRRQTNSTHSQRSPPGSLWPKERVKPWMTGSPNLLP